MSIGSPRVGAGAGAVAMRPWTHMMFCVSDSLGRHDLQLRDVTCRKPLVGWGGWEGVDVTYGRYLGVSALPTIRQRCPMS